MLLAFDWRLGLLSLAPVVLAFLIMATMTGKRMAEKMRQYGNALEAMSNEAVEYVRGIPVVKKMCIRDRSGGGQADGLLRKVHADKAHAVVLPQEWKKQV